MAEKRKRRPVADANGRVLVDFDKLAALLDRARRQFDRPAEVRIAFVVRIPWVPDGDLVYGNLGVDDLRHVLGRLCPELFRSAAPEAKGETR